MEQLQMEKDDMSNRMKNLQDGSYNLNIIMSVCNVMSVMSIWYKYSITSIDRCFIVINYTYL